MSACIDILDLAQQRQEPPFILILDALQDPQNLGTLLRTAEIVGVHGVVSAAAPRCHGDPGGGQRFFRRQ